MTGYIKGLLAVFRGLLKSKYKWLLLSYMILLYRIEFMPDTGGGLAKAIQVIALFSIVCLLYKYDGYIKSTLKI